jgi:hypothetical protein
LISGVEGPRAWLRNPRLLEAFSTRPPVLERRTTTISDFA